MTAAELVPWGAWGVFLVLWAVIGWTDIKSNKIFHRHLRPGFWACAAGYGALAAFGADGFAWTPGSLALHAAIAWTSAVALWLLGIWPAGDAKLFAMLAGFYPLLRPASAEAPAVLTVVLLINIFVPAAASLFLQSLLYVWKTRWRESLLAFLRLDPAWRLDFILKSALQDAGAWKGQLAGIDWRAASIGAARWSAGIVCAALMARLMRTRLDSPLLSSFMFLGFFIVWGRALEGRGAAAAIGASAALAGSLWAFEPASVFELAPYAGTIALFSLCLGAGTWVTRLLVKGSSPLSYALGLGLAAMPIATAALNHLAGTGASALWTMTSLGLFFGLALIMVRIWDAEVRPLTPVEQLTPYLVLSPAFVEKLRADRDFFERHFSAIYPDGLTREQAEALKGWCRGAGIESVPLTPTVSFAVWIFLGVFLTAAWRGHVLRLLLS